MSEPWRSMEDLARACGDVGLAAVDAIRPLVRPAAVLEPDAGEIPASEGASRFGGRPVLPAAVTWPQRDGKSLAFIARIDLAEHAAAPAAGLPALGSLLFFYDAEQSTWGFDPKDAGSFAVVFVEPGERATLREWPDDLPSHARYAPCPLRSEPALTLPSYESVLVEDLDLDAAQKDAYLDLLERLCPDLWASRGLLGGHPDQVQGDMMLECAMVAAGLYCGDAAAYQDPRLPELRKDAREWRLLLQVPSVEEAGMMWGDVGCLFYWIRGDDLRQRRFDRSWMILQCT